MNICDKCKSDKDEQEIMLVQGSDNKIKWICLECIKKDNERNDS